MPRHAGIKESPWSCDNCGHFFAEAYNLRRHVENRSCFDKFKCDKYRMKFTSETGLKNHMKEVDCLQCNTCKTVSASYGAMIAHRLRHKEKKHKCPQCEKAFHSKSELTDHQRAHTKEKLFECNNCHVSFTSARNLRAHERRHSGEYRVSCPQCEKPFFSASELKAHLRVHTGAKPFKCGLCDKDFASSGNRNAHMNTHIDMKIFSCLICEKTFKLLRYLNNHMKIHVKDVKPEAKDA